MLAGSVGADGGAREVFDPSRHGFGFPNWTADSQYFETPPEIDREPIDRRIRAEWNQQAAPLMDLDFGALPNPLIRAIATQLRAAVVQRAGTNGHCYGMALAAQQYYEIPEAIPVDMRLASAIDDPTVPHDDPSAPVYEDIVQLQADQFLRFRAWLGRRGMLFPDAIDTAAVLRDIRAVVERFGTASVTIFNGSLYSHQLLVYDVHDYGDRVELEAYDPNLPASFYADATATLRLDRVGDELSMVQYDRYTGLLYNRYDRIERATDRGEVSPLDHLTLSRETFRERLFPLALILADSEAVDLVVETPDGGRMERLRGEYMDRSLGTYPCLRSRYGVEPGRYRISVFGLGGTDYELRALVTGVDGTVVDATESRRIGAGDVHRYWLTIPESGTGGLSRGRSDWERTALVGGAGAVGGALAGIAGDRLRRRRRGGDGG